jgi:hypothetical protein
MFKRYISKGKIDIMHYTTGIKLNRGPVAKNHSNLDWSHESFQTIFEYFICRNWTTVKQMLFVSNDRRMMSGEIRRVISGGLPKMKCAVCYTQFQMLNTCCYLDLEGCTAFDLILQDCNFKLGCLGCSKDTSVKVR